MLEIAQVASGTRRALRVRMMRPALILSLLLLSACGEPRAPDRAELTSAAGTVRGGKYVVQYQLGHWSAQGPFAGGTYSGLGGATIKP